MRFIRDPQFVAEVQNLQQIPVRVGRVKKDKVDDDKVIAGAVRHQYVAVAVKNIAACGLNRRLVRHGVGIRRDEGVLCNGSLRLIKPQAEHADHGQNDNDEYDHAEAGNSLHLFGTNLSDRPGSKIQKRAREQTQADLNRQSGDHADVDRAEIALKQE